MSYEEKLAKARDIVSSHNQATKKPVDFDKFSTNLQEAGGTTDEALKYCTWEDLEKFGLPTLLAKQVASAFRSKETTSPRLITEARAQMMTPRELLEHYDPRNADNFVGKRLKDLSKNKQCLVYNDDGSINAEVSAKLIEELRDDYPERENVLVGDRPYNVYQVGQRPDQFAFENPLYPGSLLRPDETCDHINQSWVGVSEIARVLLYLAIQTKELRILSVDDAEKAYERAKADGCETVIRRRYPKASLQYDSLKAQGRLPTLRLSRSLRNGNDPFYNAHKRF